MRSLLWFFFPYGYLTNVLLWIFNFFLVQCFVVMSVCVSVSESHTSVPTKHLDLLRVVLLVWLWPMSIRTHLNNHEHSWTYIIASFIKHFRTDTNPRGIEQSGADGWTPRPRPAIVRGTAPLRPGPSDRVGLEWDREGWAGGKFRKILKESQRGNVRNWGGI